MEFKYTQEQVQNILDLLNTIEIKGIGNMNSILGIVQIINNPIKNQNIKED